MVGADKVNKNQVCWQQQWHETYDWAALFAGAGASSGKERIEAYFRQGLEVTHIPGKGLALRTAVAASQGELLLVEPSFSCGTFEEAVSMAGQKLTDGPYVAARRVRAQVCALSGAVAQHEGAEGKMCVPVESWGDDLPVWSLSLDDIWQRFQKNAMSSAQPVEKPDGYVALESVDTSQTALYPIAALINHDCAPNCNKLPLGPVIAIRAARDLAAGEELTFYYMDVRCPRSIREAALMRSWGFNCRCKRCVFETGLSAKVTNELSRCHQAFEALKSARQASEAELRRLVRESRRCAERGATAAEERAWLLLSVFVPVAFEFANGLCSLGQYDEAGGVFSEINKTYVQVLSCSNMHAAVAHCQSFVCHSRNSGLLEALTNSVQVHDMCYGGGVRTWRFMTRKALPAEVHGMVVQLPPKREPLKEVSSVKGEHPLKSVASTVEKGPDRTGMVSTSDATQVSSAASPMCTKAHMTQQLPAVSAGQGTIRTSILEGTLLKAEVNLDKAPEDNSIELSPLLLRVGLQTWGLPFEVNPSTAQTSWLRKRGVLRLQVRLASCWGEGRGECPTADLATLD